MTALAGPSRLRHVHLALPALPVTPTRTFSSSPAREGIKRPMWARRSPHLPLIDKQGAFKRYHPRHNTSLRNTVLLNNPHLYRGRALFDLTIKRVVKSGRNHTGRVVTKAREGGRKRNLRLVDTRRREEGPQDVVRIEYDPGRSGHIALLRNRSSGTLSYVLATDGLRAGDVVQSWPNGLNVQQAVGEVLMRRAKEHGGSEEAIEEQVKVVGAEEAKEEQARSEAAMPSDLTSSLALSNLHSNGNCLQLRDLPLGLPICNIALHPDRGGMLCRAAGTSAAIVAFEPLPSNWAHVRLSSGEVRRIDKSCVATVGRVSNVNFKGRKLGKAGRNRWLGRRPQSAGRAMNPVAHPHGGRQRKSRDKEPMSRTYVHAKGTKTRRPTWRRGNKQVVTSRSPGRNGLHTKPSAKIIYAPDSSKPY